MPIRHWPFEAPAPIPWRFLPGLRPVPGVPTVVQPQRGYDVGPALGPSPSSAPSGSVRYGPGGKKTSDPTSRHRYRKPPRRFRERKLRGSLLSTSLLGKILNAVTEFDDFVDAFYGAFPRGYHMIPTTWWTDPLGKKHPSQPTLQAKIQFVYDHWADIDSYKIGQNLWVNEVIDRFYGRVGRANALASNRLGLSAVTPDTLLRHALRGVGTPVNRILKKVYDLRKSAWDYAVSHAPTKEGK